MQVIRSSSNPLVKRLKALADKPATRREAGLYVLEGPKLALEALRAGLARELIAEEGAWNGPLEAVRKAAQDRGLRAALASKGAFAAMAGTEAPQGVLVLAALPAAAPLPAALRGLAMALDGVQDPGNLGTLLRGAWAAACELVLLSADCADPFSPKSVRAGAGAQLWVPLRTSDDLSKDLGALASAGAQIIAASPKAQRDYSAIDYMSPTCVVIGAEGKGLSANVLRASTQHVRLSYPGDAESINAAASGHIVLFEALRQRRKALKDK